MVTNSVFMRIIGIFMHKIHGDFGVDIHGNLAVLALELANDLFLAFLYSRLIP